MPPYSSFAPGYDRLLGIGNFEHLRRTFERLVARYGIRFESAADLGTGTGLFARYLSRRWGVPVFAVDASRAMLRVAARHCDGLPVTPLRQDLRALCLPCPVSLATANSDVLNHLPGEADLRLALRRIAANLRPGGHFVFDVVTPCEPMGGRRTFTRRSRDGGRLTVQRIRWDPGRRILSGVVLVRWIGRPSWLVERHVEHLFEPGAVARAVTGAGLRIRGVHDAATLETPTRCPPRLLVVAERP